MSKKVHAALERGADHVDSVLLVHRRAVAVAQSHAAEADGRDFQVAGAESAFLHVSLLVIRARAEDRGPR